MAAADTSPQRYRFADLTLDVGRREVRRGRESLRLSKLTFGALRVLVEGAPNIVTHAELVDRVWGPRRVVTPENLSQRMMMLRHALGESGERPRYVESVRGVGYRLIPEVQALPTNGEPLRSTDRSGLTLTPARSLGVTLVLVVLAAFAYVLLSTRTAPPPTAEAPPTLPLRPDAVAVLPFLNMSDDPQDEYFSDGVAEEILNVLAQDRQLKVVARTSAFAFKGVTTDVRVIANRLGAQWVVEGSARRQADLLRVTAQLIDARTGTHIWSRSFDGHTSEVFDFQQAIAEQIAMAIRGQLGVPPPQPVPGNKMTSSLEAYDRYLLGNRYFWERGREPVARAIELYQQAIDLDPEFAEAWAALAAAYNTAPAHGVQLGDANPHDLAELAAERAVELDASLGLAWMVLGNVKPRPRYRNFESGAPYIKKAIEVAPQEPTIVHWMVEGMLGVGRYQEALRYAELGYEMDPMVALRSVALGCASAANGQYERAVRFIAQARELDHWTRYVWNCGLIARLEAGDFDAAQHWLQDKPFKSSAEGASVEQLYMAARLEPSPENVGRAATGILAAYEAPNGPFVDGNFAHFMLASMGAVDEAYAIGARRMREGRYIETSWWWLPSMRSFRTDPRFIEMAEQLRLPGFWRQYGWPDTCRPAGASFMCT